MRFRLRTLLILWRVESDMRNNFALSLVAGLLVLILYLAAYLALVEPVPNFYTVRSGGSAMLMEDGANAHYKFGDTYVRWVFWPANQIDRRLRHAIWN